MESLAQLRTVFTVVVFLITAIVIWFGSKPTLCGWKEKVAVRFIQLVGSCILSWGLYLAFTIACGGAALDNPPDPLHFVYAGILIAALCIASTFSLWSERRRKATKAIS